MKPRNDRYTPQKFSQTFSPKHWNQQSRKLSYYNEIGENHVAAQVNSHRRVRSTSQATDFDRIGDKEYGAIEQNTGCIKSGQSPADSGMKGQQEAFPMSPTTVLPRHRHQFEDVIHEKPRFDSRDRAGPMIAPTSAYGGLSNRSSASITNCNNSRSTSATKINRPEDTRSGTPITSRPTPDGPKLDWIQVSEATDDSPVEAFMLVSILQARNIPAMDHGDHTNPFVEVYFNGEAYRTETVNETLNPVWNSHYLFRMPEKDKRRDITLQMVVFAEGKAFLTGDDYIGQIQVQLPTCLNVNSLHCNWTPLCTGDVERKNPSALERMLRKRCSKDLESLPGETLGDLKVAWMVLDLESMNESLTTERKHSTRLEEDLDVMKQRMEIADKLRIRSQQALDQVKLMKDEMEKMQITQQADKAFYNSQTKSLCNRLGAVMMTKALDQWLSGIKLYYRPTVHSAFQRWTYMVQLVHDQEEDAKIMGVFILRGVLSRVTAIHLSLGFNQWHAVVTWGKLCGEPSLLISSRTIENKVTKTKIPMLSKPRRSSTDTTNSNKLVRSVQTNSDENLAIHERRESIESASSKSGSSIKIPNREFKRIGSMSSMGSITTSGKKKKTGTHRRVKSNSRSSTSLTPTDPYHPSIGSMRSFSNSRPSGPFKSPGLSFGEVSHENIDTFIAALQADEDPILLENSRQMCWGKVRSFALGEMQPTMVDENINLTVAVRVRPFNEPEMKVSAKSIVEVQENQISILRPASSSSGTAELHRFAFDHCFDSQCLNIDSIPKMATQQDVFNVLGIDILENAWMGLNATLFAYGQTGAGKSHSMMGSEGQPGITMRLADHLFDSIDRSLKESNQSNEYHVEVSCVEIYNERVRDLSYCSNNQSLKVREVPGVGVFVDGLSSPVISTMDEMNQIIHDAIESRVVGATAMNAVSSRSHCIFTIKFSQKLLSPTTNQIIERMSKINLIDLAGSERSGKTKIKGDRLKEGAQINKSLSTLGRVIHTLAKGTGEDEHVPFRDSLLTWLLKESLGGNAKTAMLACLSPATINFEESLSTLRYANSAKQIKTRPVVNEDPTVRLINDLKAEIESLKSQLLEKSTTGVFLPVKLKNEGFQEDTSTEDLETLDQIMTIQAQMEKAQLSWEEKRDQNNKQRRMIRRRSFVMVKDEPKVSPYLLNIHEDPLVSERLRYFLHTGQTSFGRGGDHIMVDINFDDPGIDPLHCSFENIVLASGVCCVTVKAIDKAEVYVNGTLLNNGDQVVLQHGDRVVLGNLRLLFILIIPPTKATDVGSCCSKSFLSWQKGIFTFKEVVREMHRGGEETPKNIFAHKKLTVTTRTPDKDKYKARFRMKSSLEDGILTGFMLVEQANQVAQTLHQPVRFQLKLLEDVGKGSQTPVKTSKTAKTGQQLQFWCVWESLPAFQHQDDYTGTTVFIINEVDGFEDFVSSVTSVFQLFSRLIAKQGADQDQHDFFKKVFESLDKNDTGKINSSELRLALSSLGFTLTSQELWDIFRVYNRRKDGQLHCKEFIHFMEDHMSNLFEGMVPLPQRLQLKSIRELWAPKHEDRIKNMNKQELPTRPRPTRLGSTPQMQVDKVPAKRNVLLSSLYDYRSNTPIIKGPLPQEQRSWNLQQISYDVPPRTQSTLQREIIIDDLRFSDTETISTDDETENNPDFLRQTKTKTAQYHTNPKSLNPDQPDFDI